MSTIPDSRTTPKARTPRTRSPRRDRASFDYGYREVREKLPDGSERSVRKPLTLDDVLHPQFGDVHVLSDPHSADCTYLRVVAEARNANDPSVVVLSDCGIFWDIPDLRHHSPDFALIFGVKRRKEWTTFDVKTEKVRPSLIIEVTSRDTRVTDLEDKVAQFARARVPYYVIADAREGPRDKPRPRQLKLIAYRLKGKIYERMQADQQGRVRLEPLNLLLGVRMDPRTGGDRLVLIDPATNQEIGDYAAVEQARAAEAQAREQAEAQAKAAEAQAKAAEVQAKAAEAQAKAAEAQAKAAEAQAKAAAERAESEAQARAAAEARIRELEAELSKGRKRRK